MESRFNFAFPVNQIPRARAQCLGVVLPEQFWMDNDWPEGNTARMELRQFIKSALSDIHSAVSDFDKEFPGFVAVGKQEKPTSHEFMETGFSPYQKLDIEVTVRADERQGSEAKLNVVAAVIGGGVKGESGKSGGHSATLRFSIPIHYIRIQKGAPSQ